MLNYKVYFFDFAHLVRFIYHKVKGRSINDCHGRCLAIHK